MMDGWNLFVGWSIFGGFCDEWDVEVGVIVDFKTGESGMSWDSDLVGVHWMIAEGSFQKVEMDIVKVLSRSCSVEEVKIFGSLEWWEASLTMRW